MGEWGTRKGEKRRPIKSEDHASIIIKGDFKFILLVRSRTLNPEPE
jgi:hypothetical protein